MNCTNIVNNSNTNPFFVLFIRWRWNWV